jgi:sulfur-carrier protein
MTAVRIPPVLRAQAGNNKQLDVTGSTVGEVLDALLGQYPSLRDQLMTPDGGLNRFVNVYVNGRDVRYEQELATPVSAEDTVILLPAMAGGGT